MGNFIEIISNYDAKMGNVDQSIDLHNWMTLLTKFTGNKPLPRSIINSIDSHFAYYWQNDRMAYIHQDDAYMDTLPRSIMTNYLFKDLFYNFRQFFLTYEN